MKNAPTFVHKIIVIFEASMKLDLTLKIKQKWSTDANYSHIVEPTTHLCPSIYDNRDHPRAFESSRTVFPHRQRDCFFFDQLRRDARLIVR